MKKGFGLIGILIVVGIIVLGGGGYYYLLNDTDVTVDDIPESYMSDVNGNVVEEEPHRITQDETADWKTYRNEEYGFEFKYPENASIIEDNSPKWAYFSVIINTPDSIFFPAIYIIKNTDKLTLEDRKREKEEEPYVVNVKEISILGKNAISYEAEMGAYLGEIVDKNYIYRFSAFGLWQKYKILDTFKFLN